MKLFYVSLILFVGSFSSNAQNSLGPRDEFGLFLPDIPIKVYRGDSTVITLTILKSKGFLKAKTILKVKPDLPKGVFIKTSPEIGVFDKTKVTIIVSEEAQVGQVSLNITAEMRHIKKGLITTFEIL
ncbi:MAG TPA: hypothetical protein VK175_12755 [Leadbetterella sp.]|nr:hypothetical protein [Leadbetterella sp.]